MGQGCPTAATPCDRVLQLICMNIAKRVWKINYPLVVLNSICLACYWAFSLFGDGQLSYLWSSVYFALGSAHILLVIPAQRQGSEWFWSLQSKNFSIPFGDLASLPRIFNSSISFQDGRIAPLHNNIPDLNGHCPILDVVCFSRPQQFSQLSTSVHFFHLKCIDIEAGLLFLLPYKTIRENIVKVGKCRK